VTVTLNKPLSAALREATAHAHENAEGSAFMQRLMSGQLSRAAAADLTGQLWFVYESLERAVRSVAHPRLERRYALEADLAALVGGDWREKIRILPATAAYVARLEEVSGSAVEVVAHHYVRYLGDVSGGQVIAARLGALYDIESDALNFYDFTAIGKIPPYRKGYRERLDGLSLTAGEREALLSEAQRAFAFNSGIFAELDKRH